MTATTPQDRVFPSLNAVRAVAALGVVATHTAFDTGEIGRGWQGAFLSRLDFGVTLFFVLSGFLLSRPFFLNRARGTTHPSYRHFLWKRGLRILPLYWVTVVLALVLLPENNGTGAASWIRELTLTQIYAPGLLPTGLTQLWSLCSEVAFYVVLPALCWGLLRLSTRGEWRPGRILAALAAISVLGVAWQVAAGTESPTTEHYHQWLPGFLPWFCIGLAFAVVSATQAAARDAGRRTLLDRMGSDVLGCWLAAGSLFAVACTPIAGPRLLLPPTAWEAFFKCTLYGFTAGLLVLPLVFGPEHEGLARRLTSSPVMVWLGDISYGIFCLHLLVLESVFDVLHVPVFTGRFSEIFLLSVAGTVVLSAISFYLLERPLLRLKNVNRFAAMEPTATPRPTTISS